VPRCVRRIKPQEQENLGRNFVTCPLASAYVLSSIKLICVLPPGECIYNTQISTNLFDAVNVTRVQVTVSGRQTEVILQNLIADSEYSVIVTAVSDSSAGPPSPVISVRTLQGKSINNNSEFI